MKDEITIDGVRYRKVNESIRENCEVFKGAYDEEIYFREVFCRIPDADVLAEFIKKIFGKESAPYQSSLMIIDFLKGESND